MLTTEAILNSDDPSAKAFNAGYDDYPEDLNPFGPNHHPRLWRFYQHGQDAAKAHAEEKQAEQDEELYNREYYCQGCGGVLGPEYSTCICDDPGEED